MGGINKSAGISVQGGKGITHPLDLELSMQLGYKIFLVHRLDKETAGLMIVAKSPKAAAKWINLISRFKNTMLKNKAKALPISNYKEKHKQFTDYYKQDNFSSNITEQETKEHEQYNEFNKSNQKDIER